MLQNLIQDVRYTLRSARRDAAFFSVAILIVGLGIGANTALFSVINPLLFRPLPFASPGDLVWIANTGGSGLSGVTSRTSNLRDYRRLSESFESITGYFAFFDYSGYTLVGEGEPERLVGVGVARNFLEVLGVRTLLGRNFVEEESVWNGRPATLLTHGFWERRFGADEGIVGRTITLNDESTTVVGVLPASFDFASAFSPGSRIDILTPFPISDETDEWGNTLSMIGRLAEADPRRWGLDARVTELQQQITGPLRQALLVLACAVGAVMLIVCVNLSNLLLARAATRSREVAVRSALGASRPRLIRQMLTESFVLSGCGAVVGLLGAFGAVRVIASTTAFDIPLLRSVVIDGHVLLFTIGIATAAALLFGIVPALQLSKGGERQALSQSGRGSSDGRGQAWLREALVVAEVALACVLLVGGGLLLRSFVTLLDVDLGFEPAGATAWRIETGRQFGDEGARVTYHERLADAVREIPGVESVGFTDALPLGRNRNWGLRVKGKVYAEDQGDGALPRLVDSGYLQTMRIPLVAGRYFAPEDTDEREKVAIINESMARRVLPGEDPLGRLLLVASGEWRIVGIVGDVRHASLEEEAGNEMYLPLMQLDDWGSLDLVVRGKAAQIVDRAVSPRRFVLYLLGAFALSALLLASLGIYGVLSYSVSQRTQEIGIRMALGESTGQVRRRLVVRTLGLASIGIVLGWAGSVALARLITSLLYGVSPTDPATLAAMMTLLLLVSGLAGYLPARRASRIDPIVALRVESGS